MCVCVCDIKRGVGPVALSSAMDEPFNVFIKEPPFNVTNAISFDVDSR